MAEPQAGQGGAWTPSAKAKLLVKQLGISAQQLSQALTVYNQLQLRRDDDAFLMWLGDFLKGMAATPANKQLLIPLDWRPDARLNAHLRERAYPQFLIDFHVEAFVLEQRERGAVTSDWGAAYQRYLQQHCQRAPARQEEALLLQGVSRQQLREWQALYHTLPRAERPEFQAFCEALTAPAHTA